MARQSRRTGPQRQVRGFRPGKEPPQLRKQRAKEQLGGEVSGAQERLIEFFADRSPGEAAALIRRWRLGLLIGGILLAVLGAALYPWSVVAGVVVHVLAVGLLFLAWQIHRRRGDLESMAELVGGRGAARRGRRRGRGR